MATVDIRGRGKGPISVNKSSLPFGNVALGTAVVQSVTLTSTSRSTFTLNSASTTGAGFSIVGGGLPMTLNPGQSTTLQVQFQPTAAGSVTGLMTVKTSATTGSLPVVSLSGTGVNGAVAQPDPQLTVSTIQSFLRQLNCKYRCDQDDHSYVFGQFRVDRKRGIDGLGSRFGIVLEACPPR